MTQTTIQTRAAKRELPAEPAARPAERVAVVDMLRGLALCGILLIHVANFARPGAPPGLGYIGSALNELILAGLILFIEAKFFCLFALLFGVSFAVQRESAARRDTPFAPIFRRRLLILGLIGGAHILLIWEGDILLLYAALGLLLIPVRDVASARLVRWATTLLAVPTLVVTLALGGLMLARHLPEAAPLLTAAERDFAREFANSRLGVIARYANENPLAGVWGRAQSYLQGLPLLLVRAPAVLAMFLLGFVIGREGILREPERHLALLRRARAWGLGIGLTASALITLAYSLLPPFTAMTALGLNQVFAGPVLAIGYAATFVLAARRPRWGRLLAPLGPYGRVALSVYLLQSTICGLLFYGFGLGLVLAVTPLQALAIAVAVNGALIALSHLWLRHFRYGAVEWAWRSLTLGVAQPFRIAQAPTRSPRSAPASSAPRGAPRRGTAFDVRRAREQR